MKKLFYFIAFSLLLATSLVSCKKEETSDNELEQTATNNKETSQVDAIYNSINNIVDNVSSEVGNSATSSSSLKSSSVVTYPDTIVVTVTTPITITVNYGPDGYTLANGDVVKGKIIFTKSKPYTTVGCVENVSFENFYYNNHKVEGTIRWERTDVLIFSRNASIVVTTPQNLKHIQSSNYTFNFINGFNVLLPETNILHITGSVNGTTTTGWVYSHQIVESKPIVFNGTYKHAVSGEILIKNPIGEYIMDFGDGTRDNKVTLQKADGTGEVYNMTLD